VCGYKEEKKSEDTRAVAVPRTSGYSGSSQSKEEEEEEEKEGDEDKDEDVHDDPQKPRSGEPTARATTTTMSKYYNDRAFASIQLIQFDL